MFRIAVEEAFATDEMLVELSRIVNSKRKTIDKAFSSIYGPVLNSTNAEPLRRRLLDVSGERLSIMDAHGISVQILSLTAPGVQMFSTGKACDIVARCNDYLLTVLEQYPRRYFGLLSVAPQAPEFSAAEIARLASHANIVGVIINSHTNGKYLDSRKYDVIFKAAEDHGLPLYLHPNTPSSAMADPYSPYGLAGPIWGFAAETSLHALRLMFSGVFDRFPRLKVILGHLGEGLPFWTHRLDSRIGISQLFDSTGQLKRLMRKPSEYLTQNFCFSTSGMNSAVEVKFVKDVMGEDNLMFAVDYPYEDTGEAVNGIESGGFSTEFKQKLYFKNAQRIFNCDFSLSDSI